MKYPITTQKQLRQKFFWSYTDEGLPRPKRLSDGDYPTDVRVEFVDFVDRLARDGFISEALARRATL